MLAFAGRVWPVSPLIRYVDPADFLSRDHCLLAFHLAAAAAAALSDRR